MKIVRTAVGLPEIHGLDLWSVKEMGVFRMVLYIVDEKRIDDVGKAIPVSNCRGTVMLGIVCSFAFVGTGTLRVG